MKPKPKPQYVPDMIAAAKRVNVSLSKLRLDIGNVRFIHLPEEDKKIENDVEKLILDDPKTIDLCSQIQAAGMLLEPIVIDSNYRVIEGNRRLVCLRILDKAAKDDKLEGVDANQFSKVPCRMLPVDINSKTIDIYLVNIHVRSKLPWKRFNRAKYIYRLFNVHKMTYDEMSEKTGMSRPMIARDIKVYRQVQKYAIVFPDDEEWVRKFTYFEEAYKRKDLRNDVENESFLNKFSKWVHDNKFHDVRDVRILRKVLDNPNAREIFEKDNMDAARRYLEVTDVNADRNFKKIDDTINFIQSVDSEDIDNIASNPEKMKLILTLQSELEKLLIDLRVKAGLKGGKK
jgi:hypothetical protein